MRTYAECVGADACIRPREHIECSPTGVGQRPCSLFLQRRACISIHSVYNRLVTQYSFAE